MRKYLFPWQHEIQAWEEGAAVFAKSIDYIYRTFFYLVHREACRDDAHNQHHDQQNQGGERSEEYETANQQEQEEAANDTKRPVDVVSTSIVEHHPLQYHNGGNDQANRPDTIRV